MSKVRISLLPRPSMPPVSDCLQYAKTEEEDVMAGKNLIASASGEVLILYVLIFRVASVAQGKWEP